MADIPQLWWVAPIGSVLALIFAFIFFAGMKSADEGDELMQRISKYVREGAMAYLRQQYKIVFVVFIGLSAILAFMAFGLHVQHPIVPFAFLTGGFFSGLCGWIGMYTATLASHRTTAGARKSLNDGLVVAFRSGAVMGLIVVGFGLIDIVLWFLLLYSGILPFEMSLNDITVVMLTFGMGASTQALFARVGGGIYTKAADVGADLVGKVEAGIPEDDARNPATIADNVGDNVGDVAGMGADLYESYCGSILATAALGVAAATALFGGSEDAAFIPALKMLATPMVLAGVGIILSIIGIYMVRTKEGATMTQLLNALRVGIYGSTVLIAVAAWFICQNLLGDISGEGGTVSAAGVFGAILVGLVAGNIIGFATEYYTSYEYEPTKKLAEQAVTGPATVIIAGVALGMKSTWTSLLTIIISIILAFIFAGGQQEFLLGLYGVGIAAVGMLATLGITLATDAYGPIADNAGTNPQKTQQQPIERERTDALDSLGNTTAATGKGFAIGSAALTALALLAAYVEEVR
ncbi:MAG: sodium/proton-translocating pyrophosphatase, partial [Phycisphaerae bacterium]